MKAKSFDEILKDDILKFNPYHDAKGRFASANSATSFTWRTKDPNQQHLANDAKEREKVRTGGAAASDTTEETPRMKAIHSVEDKIRNQNYESAAVIDSDGNSVFFKDGAQSKVGFTPMECMMMKDNTLTHNHPRSSMFSMEDTLCFVRNDLQEIRATNREGITYSIKRGDGYDKNRGIEFVKDYDTNYKSACQYAQRDLDRRGFRDKIFNGEISQEQANVEFGRVVTNVMVNWSNQRASDYGIDFSVEKRAVQKQAPDTSIGKAAGDGEELVLDQETNELMDAAFNEWLNADQTKKSVAKTFDEIMDVEKFNPYHDARGRFASAGSAASFTYSPGKSKAHDNAIAREKDRIAAIMPTEVQAKALKTIENRTRNLKKEQFRVVDRDGNVVMQKQGDRNSVSYSVGEARDNFPGNITIHNHPDGGTFSSADLSDIGYGATEIRAAAPEGTYTLRNINHGTKWTAEQKSWYEMRDDLDAASQNFKSSRELKKELRKPIDEKLQPLVQKWEKLRDSGAPMEEQRKVAEEYTKALDDMKPQLEQATRAAYVAQYHKWYQSNAGNYGFEYIFTPAASRTSKSVDSFDEIEKGSGDGEIVLDRKIREDVEEIMAEILSEYSRGLMDEETQKSFSIFKTDDDKRLVFGWASVSITVDGEQLEDRQQDLIDPEDLEEAAYLYVLNFRDTGERHNPNLRKKGKLVESCVFTVEKQKAMGIPEGILPVGWWIGFKIEDDEAWEKVKNGTYKMFSIEGKAVRVPVE